MTRPKTWQQNSWQDPVDTSPKAAEEMLTNHRISRVSVNGTATLSP